MSEVFYTWTRRKKPIIFCFLFLFVAVMLRQMSRESGPGIIIDKKSDETSDKPFSLSQSIDTQTKEMISIRSKGLGINIDLKRSSRTVIQKNHPGRFFSLETEKPPEDTNDSKIITNGEINTQYNGLDTQGNLYKKEPDGNWGFHNGQFIELEEIKETLYVKSTDPAIRYSNIKYMPDKKNPDRYTQYPPHTTLDLPHDISITELPQVIKALDTQNLQHQPLGEKTINTLPPFSATHQTQIFFLQSLLFLHSKKDEMNTTPQGEKTYKKARKQYIMLYTNLYADEDHSFLTTIPSLQLFHTKLLEQATVLEKTADDLTTLSISVGNIQQGLSQYWETNTQDSIGYNPMKTYEQELQMTMGHTNVTLDHLENLVKSKILSGFDTAIFDHGKQTLADYMTTMTKHDREGVLKQTEYRITDRLMRFFPGSKTLGTLTDPVQQEAAIKIIISEITDMKTANHYTLENLLGDNTIQCVLGSTLMHIFLEKLGIDHTGVWMPGHFALKASINKKQWYVDPVNTIFFKIDPSKGDARKEKIPGEIRPETFYEGEAESFLKSAYWYNIGQMYGRQSRNTSPEAKHAQEIAYQCYSKALEGNPQGLSIYQNRADIARIQRKYSEVVTNCTQYLALAGEQGVPVPAAIYAMRGQAYKNQKNIEQARIDYNTAVEKSPDSVDIRYERLSLAYDTGDYETALKDAEIIISSDPSTINAYILQALCHEQLAFRDKANHDLFIHHYKEGVYSRGSVFVLSHLQDPKGGNRLKYQESFTTKRRNMPPDIQSAYRSNKSSLGKRMRETAKNNNCSNEETEAIRQSFLTMIDKK